MTTVTYKLNGGSFITLANNTYDDLGGLKKNSRNGVSSLSDTYEYNVRSWFTEISSAQYVENLTYDYDGNILSLQHYGKTAQSDLDVYGLVDNLTMTYSGNQLTNVSDAAVTVTLPESNDFKKGSTANPGYAYDKNGNLTKDLNKKITAISYNSLYLPELVTIDGVTHKYTYAADGRKLKVTQGSTSRDYAGSVIYENGSLKRILVEGGYIEGGTYYFYFNDHLGNVRAVIDGGNHNIQFNHYYPFGLPMAETTDGKQNEQPYKYNGKEFERKNGLNWVDYGARHYDAALGRFTTMDRFAEKYYSVSPYQYAGNNPVGNIDINGDSIVVLHLTTGEHLGMLIQNDSEQWQYYSFNGDKIYNSTEGSMGGGPKDNKGEQSWTAPQDFLDDDYNRQSSNRDLENGEVNGYGYQEGYMIPTTKKQDKMIRKAFLETIDKGYSLLNNQCSMAVQKALNAAGVKTQVDYSYSPMGAPAMYSSRAQYNPYLPSVAYRAIIANNPNGIYIKKR